MTEKSRPVAGALQFRLLGLCRRLAWIRRRGFGLVVALRVIFITDFALIENTDSAAELLIIREAHRHSHMNAWAFLEIQNVIGIDVGRKPIAPVDILAVAFKVRELLIADFRNRLA